MKKIITSLLLILFFFSSHAQSSEGRERWNIYKDTDGMFLEPSFTTISAYKLVPFRKNIPNRGTLGGQFLGIEIITLIPLGGYSNPPNLPINFSYHLLNADWSNNLNGDRTEKSDAAYLRIGICPKYSMIDRDNFTVDIGASFGWGLAWTNIPSVDNTDGFQGGIDISISLSVNLSNLLRN